MMWKISVVPLFLVCLRHQTVSAAAQHGNRILQGTEDDPDRVRNDLVLLIPFDVQIAMSESEVDLYALTDIMTEWMTESFTTKSTSEGLLSNGTSFNSVALELVDHSLRKADDIAGQDIVLFTASMEGVSLWDRVGNMTRGMDPKLVELIQRATFLENSLLLQRLQDAEDSTGLGDTVADVRVYVTVADDGSNSQNSTQTDSNSSTNQNLEIIIIIAIIVACLAFALLVFAVVWAWRSDRESSEVAPSGSRSKTRPSRGSSKKATLVMDGTGSESDFGDGVANAAKAPASWNSKKKSPKNNASSSANKYVQESSDEKAPPAEIESADDHHYPESVISEDISTSLTAYYKSGVSGYDAGAGKKSAGRYGGGGGGDLNDAASVSSIDSYGYSLDGYAPSLGPAQGGYPVGPLQAARNAPVTVGDEDDVAVEDEEPEDYEAGTL